MTKNSLFFTSKKIRNVPFVCKYLFKFSRGEKKWKLWNISNQVIFVRKPFLSVLEPFEHFRKKKTRPPLKKIHPDINFSDVMYRSLSSFGKNVQKIKKVFFFYFRLFLYTIRAFWIFWCHFLKSLWKWSDSWVKKNK